MRSLFAVRSKNGEPENGEPETENRKKRADGGQESQKHAIIKYYTVRIKMRHFDTYNKRTGVKQMKFRVYHKDGKYFPTYFKTKKEAIEFQSCYGGEIQRKIGGNWCGY
jgi:hypothetical protein